MSWVTSESLVLVFFATLNESVSIKEFFQFHLEGIHADVLVNIDQEDERRKWFDWYDPKQTESIRVIKDMASDNRKQMTTIQKDFSEIRDKINLEVKRYLQAKDEEMLRRFEELQGKK